MARRPIQPEDLLKMVFVSDAQIHPNGDSVLYTRKTIGTKNDYRTQLASVDLQGQVKFWTAAEFGARQGRWSPDGSKIAFVSKRSEEASQIWLLPTRGGEAVALTALSEGDIGEFRWSPDGKMIAFTFRKTPHDFTGAAAKERKEKGLSDPPRVAENGIYRWDGEGFFLGQRHAFYVIDVAKGRLKALCEACPWGHYLFDWSPDSSRLAVKRSFQANLLRDPEDDRILVMDLSGKAQELAGQPAGFKSALRWSPDGKWVAYLGNPDPLDHRGVGNTELFVSPAAGGEPKRLTQSADCDLEVSTLSDLGESGGAYLEWAPDAKSLFVSIGWHGASQLASVDLKGKLTIRTEGNHLVLPGPPSRDGRQIPCVISDAARPAEIAIWGPGDKSPRRLTRENEALFDELRVAEPEEFWIQAADGYPVHGWVLRPEGSKKPRSTVLEIHGGPQAQYGWTYFHEFQVLAAAGYSVVYSNPRGSKGYGRAHVAAIAGAWGQKDWLDIEAVRDWMKKQPSIDSDRIGVMGGSYGGYLVNWAVGHTHDFRAAITDRCVSNLLAKALNSDYPYYGGTYWKGSGYGPLKENEDLWRDSPLAHFDKVQTPMLIIHSEGDLRCHIEQSEQIFFALQSRGIESRFIRYPISTSHGMSRGGPPDLRLHRLRQILKWWKRHI